MQLKNWLIRSCQALTILAVLTLLGISLAASLNQWPADMLAPFRPHLLFFAFVGFIACLPYQKPWIIILATLTIVASALPMAIRIVDRPLLLKTSPGRAISLVFSNVLCDNRDFENVVAMAKTQNADIFAAAETTPQWISHLDALKEQYPYSLAPDNLGVFGLALYAKRPFTSTLYRIGRRHIPLIRADFGDMIIYVAHPMPPANARLNFDNREYIEELAMLVKMETRPIIIVGDLNTTLWSNNINPLLLWKMQWPKGSGAAYSWPVAKPWMAIQIDHVLTKGFSAGTFKTLGDIGSDHYPVRADLVL